MTGGIVLYPAGAGAWRMLARVLGRWPAQHRRRDGGDAREYAVLYGGEVRTALAVPGVEPTGLDRSQVSLVPVEGMVARRHADLEAMPQQQRTTASCALCGRIARLTGDGLLARHAGREPAADGFRAVSCKASRHTPDEAEVMAKEEAAELDALRLRAHP